MQRVLRFCGATVPQANFSEKWGNGKIFLESCRGAVGRVGGLATDPVRELLDDLAVRGRVNLHVESCLMPGLEAMTVIAITTQDGVG